MYFFCYYSNEGNLFKAWKMNDLDEQESINNKVFILTLNFEL